MMSASGLRLATWNVNGLGDKIKRSIVLQYIHRHQFDLLLLQETHLKGNSCAALDRKGYKMIAHSGFTTSSRGTGILLHKSCPYVIQQIWTDPHGRFAAWSGQWEGRVLNVVSVYAPPGLQRLALTDIGKLLLDLPVGTLIVGGDFNLVLDDLLDRAPPKPGPSPTTPLRQFTDALGLVDIWR